MNKCKVCGINVECIDDIDSYEVTCEEHGGKPYWIIIYERGRSYPDETEEVRKCKVCDLPADRYKENCVYHSVSK